MKKLLIFSLLAGLLIAFFSCDKTEKDYSDSDAVFQKIIKTYTLKGNDSINYRYQHTLDLNSYYAFNRMYGETFVVYNPNHQELKINESVTTMADGKKVPSPENAFNEVLPRSASGAPPYSHLREMVITHTGLEKNSTIKLDYEIKSDNEIMPYLMGNEVLAQNSPVKELIIRVRVPEGKKLNYKLLNAEEKLNISKKGKTTEYEWVFNNIEAISQEDHQPQSGSHLPRLLFSTIDFNKAYQHLNEEISYALPESIQKSIDEAVLNSKTKLDSIRAIQKMVVNHTNYFRTPLKYTGYQLKDNETVLEDNGGRLEEKTVLLASLLKHVGVSAEPVMIIPKEYYDNNMGNLETIEKYFVNVKNQGEDIYLSAIHHNKTNKKYALAEHKNIVLSEEAPEFIDFEEKTSTIELKGEFVLTSDFSMEGNLHASLDYNENPYLSIKENELAIKSLLTPLVQPESVKEYSVETISPVHSEIDYTIKQNIFPRNQDSYYFMDIPEIHSGLDKWQLNPLSDGRISPLEIGYPINLEYNYQIKLPDDIEVISASKNVNINNDIGKILIKLEKTDSSLNILRNLKIETKVIQPGEYDQLKEILDPWHKEKHKTLVLKNKG